MLGGLFGGNATCDWCGASFEGEGLTAGAMTFCSQACLDQRNAPPAPEGPSIPLTDETARSELAIAEAELEHYFHSAMKIDGRACPEDAFMATQHTLVGVWLKLDAVRAHVASRGGDVAAYDTHRASFDAHPDRYETNALQIRDDHPGTAHFRRENFDGALVASRLLRSALDG